MANHAAALEKAARLALIASRDDWAWISLELPGGVGRQRYCTADENAVPAIPAALGELAAQVVGDGCMFPDLDADAAALPPACLEQVRGAGVRSYRAVRRNIVHGMGQGSCVLAVASAALRAPDPDVERALGLLADLFVDGVAVQSRAGQPGDARLVQEQFRLLFESAPGLYLVLAPDSFRILAASNAYLEATMVTREQVIGRPMFDVFPDDPEDEYGDGVVALNTSLQRVRQTGRPDVMAVQRYSIRRPAGAGGGFELRYWSPINSPVLDADGSVMFIIHRVEDVTDYVLAHRPAATAGGSGPDADPGAALRKTTRLEAEIVLRSHELKRMADSLAQSEQRLRLQAEMLDYATDAILVRDLDNRVLYWNQAAAARYGWSSEEVIGRPVGETLYAQCAPSDFQHAMQVLMRHGDYSGRMVHSAADGRKFVVHVHWILVRHEDGAPRAILSVVTDLSEQVALEQRLLQIQKLESLGRLTGGLAHDFNNWLTVIIGNAEELVDSLAGHEELREIARMIQLAGERGAELTRRLLAFGRRQSLMPAILDVGEELESIRPLIARSLPGNIELQLLETEHRWCVHADRSQLEAAIINLCINARDAMPDGGRLGIRLMLAEMDDRKRELNRSLASGEYVVIAVEDSGHGIAQDVLDHVFEPFFTTKDEASGSGLGLSMVYGFVMQSNGEVTIYSEPGHGTMVKLYLPRAYSEPQQPVAVPADAVTGPPRGCSVLFVEDDPIVRAHILAQLGELGCAVTAASRAEEALLRLEQGESFDILFTDVVMPGMSGIELAGRARALRPGLRILLSSGYSFDALRHRDELGPEIRFLNKPYGKAVLARTLTDVLGAQGRAP